MAEERTQLPSFTGEPSVDSFLREAATTTPLDPPEEFAGTERYAIVRRVGEGGFGVVYEANDRVDGGRVALKLLRRPYAERLYRFKREFRGLSEVVHDNLVKLHELVAVGRDVFFTMELIDGLSLFDHIALRPDRTVETMRGLAEGIAALHRAGKLHRDVKPSNVLVDKSGRVVLLDFGLAIDIDEVDRTRNEFAGTPRYMSPEQCSGAPLTEASDWYAFGVVLFEALTGKKPFSGTTNDVVYSKQTSDAPRVSSIVVGVAPELEALCAALLERDPTRRPRGAEVLAELRGAPQPARSPKREKSDPFVGRESELTLLDALAARAAAGHRTIAMASGPSGIGKSALLRRFLERLRQKRPDTLVLAGRCYERESVPYKALDAVVDELAHRLRQLPEGETASLVPHEAAALVQLFPVLRQVPVFQRLDALAAPDEEAAEIRARGGAALRALFDGLARRRPVVVCIDDLQWGDVDSAALLGELLRAPAPPPIFWLATFREEEATTSPLLRRLQQLREGALRDVEIHSLCLTGLASDEARALAAELLEDEGARAQPERAHTIADESGGSPFFVYELAKRGSGVHALGDLVRARVARLEGSARRILEVAAVAARPLELRVLVDAIQLHGSELRAAMAVLRGERLIRARDGHDGDRHDGDRDDQAQGDERLVECYHDRIREAVAGALLPEAQRALHLALAGALERQGSSDAARLGRHFADGGDGERGCRYLVLAAERAASALAFDEAAQRYQRAIELGAGVEVELACAEVLSAAGRGAEAARRLLGAIERVAPERRIILRRRAAEELLFSGRIDEGFTEMETVLAELGLSMPRSKTGALVTIALGRARRAIFGRHLAEARRPTERELSRIDTLASLVWSTMMFDPLKGAALQSRHLTLALASGDRTRASIALSLEAPINASMGQHVLTRETLRWARELAGDSELVSSVDLAESVVALLDGRWVDSLGWVERTKRNGIAGHASSHSMILMTEIMSLFWMGRSGDTLRRLPSLIRDMDERGNLHGWLWMVLLEGWALSCSGRLDEAWASSRLVMERLPARGFELLRWYLEFGQVKYFLIDNKPEEAWQRLVEAERRTRFGLVGESQRVSRLWVHANTALARALETPSLRGPMLGEARKMARQLDGVSTPWVSGVARSVRASIASVEGDRERALALLDEAAPLLEEHHLEAVLACAQIIRGEARSDGALVERGRAWMAAQQVDPTLARLHLPGAWSA